MCLLFSDSKGLSCKPSSSPACLCESPYTDNNSMANGLKLWFWQCLMIFTIKLNNVWKSSYYPRTLPGSSLFKIHASSGLQVRVHGVHSARNDTRCLFQRRCLLTTTAYTSSKMLSTAPGTQGSALSGECCYLRRRLAQGRFLVQIIPRSRMCTLSESIRIGNGT